MKLFGSWTMEELHQQFGLQEVDSILLMEEWAESGIELTATEKQELAYLCKEAQLQSEYWNEDDLKMNFIAPIMRLVYYNVRYLYKAFYQRSFQAKIGEIEIGGTVDMLVAKGWYSPTIPYFFLHEYKQEQGGKADARAQLLAAMLAAQTLNPSEKPVLGVYLVGASWRFTLLQGKKYCIKRLDTTHEHELIQTYKMLKWVKAYIEQTLRQG